MILLRFLAYILTIFFGLSSFYALIAVLQYIQLDVQKYGWFLAGFIVFLLIFITSRGRLRNNLYFLKNFTHEFNHAFFTLILFGEISSFWSTPRKGGRITHRDGFTGFRRIIRRLSPYFFPIYTVFILLLHSFFRYEVWRFVEFTMGFSYSFHLLCFAKDLSPQQSDFKKEGIFFSYLFILSMNIFFFGLVLLDVGNGGLAALKMYGIFFYRGLMEVVQSISDFTQVLIE